MNKSVLNEIKAKFPNRIKKLGEALNDPILSPYPFFCFLADRDPTDDEPLVYHDYDGLILFWVNQASKEIFVSPDNMDETLGWQKIITENNIKPVLYKAQGTATLSLGAVSVSCASLAANDIIQLNYRTMGGTPGAIFVSSVNPGTGFTVHSSSLLDSSTFAWNVLN